MKKNTVKIKVSKKKEDLNKKQLVNVTKDGVGRQAEFYIRKSEELKSAKEAFAKSETQLVAELLLAGRKSIDLGGETLSVNHIDSKDKIKREKTNKGPKRKFGRGRRS